MDRTALAFDLTGQNRRLADTIRREQGRLRSFIRTRVADIEDAEDILQDVFCELIEAVRLMKPIEHASAWLFRVARNRITDLYRKRKPALSIDAPLIGAEPLDLLFEDLLPSTDAGPDAAYARRVLLDELNAAIDDLPSEQRDVFMAHQLEGRSFKELAEETGVSVNTLLARKHYAVLRLRRRLQAIHDEFRHAGGEPRMKRYRLARALKFVLFALVAVTVLTAVVMSLWNWLMPSLFGLGVITFWQALGLLVFSRILFGRFGRPGRLHWRHRMMKRWGQMTPEEREKFMAGMGRRCGQFESTTPGPAAESAATAP